MESIPQKKSPILVVDDDEGLLLSIQATLISSGLPEPALVSDSRRVIDLLRAQRFPLVLLDLMMPFLGGMEVLKQIKEEIPETDCIIVSAVDDVTTAVGAIKNGACDYLVKPLNSEKLVALVRSHLERCRLQDQLKRFGRKRVFENALEYCTRCAKRHAHQQGNDASWSANRIENLP